MGKMLIDWLRDAGNAYKGFSWPFEALFTSLGFAGGWGVGGIPLIPYFNFESANNYDVCKSEKRSKECGVKCGKATNLLYFFCLNLPLV